jgi:hypothetical protein
MVATLRSNVDRLLLARPFARHAAIDPDEVP